MNKAGELKPPYYCIAARGHCTKIAALQERAENAEYNFGVQLDSTKALQERLKQAEEVIKDLNKYADKKGLSSLMFMQRVINRLEKYKDDKGE